MPFWAYGRAPLDETAVRYIFRFMGEEELKGFDGIDDFRELVEEIRALPLKERREAFGELFRLCVHPLVERARSDNDVSKVLSLLEQTWRIGFEAGVIDRPPPPRSTH